MGEAMREGGDSVKMLKVKRAKVWLNFPEKDSNSAT